MTTAISESISVSGETLELGTEHSFTQDASSTSATVDFNFSGFEDLLSQRPLKRSRRPLRMLTNDELKVLARQNPPPPEWLEGSEDRPF